jgi:DNA-binding transcriptional LysR family regulator
MLSSLSDADLKLLRVFQTIVACGGVSQAQPELNSSQSTISTQLAQLEARLGFRLCNRGRRGFSLTERGRVVHEEARILFSAIDDFRVRITERANELEGELRLGLIEGMINHPEFRFAEAVRRFRRRSSRSTIDLHIESVINLESMVLDGRLHLAVTFCHHRLPSLSYQEVLTERHFLYCGAKHPLFGAKRADQILDGIAKASYVSRSYLENSVKPPELELVAAAKTDNMEGLALLILSGEFIAFLPDHIAKPWVAAGEMRPLLPGKINHTSSFHLIQAKGDRLPNIAAAFVEDFMSTHSIRVTS